MKKILAIILICCFTLSSAVITVWGQPGVKVIIDNNNFNGSVVVKNNTTYVDLISFANSVTNEITIYLDNDLKILYIKAKDLYIMCELDKGYIIANERYLYHQEGIMYENGKVYAPIMQAYKAFNCNIKWCHQTGGFIISSSKTAITEGNDYYRQDEVFWLARIIHAEASGESLLGKIAVGNVVLNRVRSPEFPNTIFGVIFDKKYGVQFTPVASGTIYNQPNEESIIAAKICLEYYSINPDILYFVNPHLAPQSWASQNRLPFRKIGNHQFYY